MASFYDQYLAPAVSSVIGTAVAPAIEKAAQAQAPAVQASVTSGVKSWLSEHEGTLIVGALALVAIVVGIYTVGRAHK